jgi:hypothetical protein
MPSEAPLDAAGERRSGQPLATGIDPQIEEAHRRLDAGEVAEQVANLAARIDLRQQIPGPVGVVGEEEVPVAQVSEAVLGQQRPMALEYLRVLPRCPCDGGRRAGKREETGERAPQHQDGEPVVKRVPVVHHHERRAAGTEHAMEFAHDPLRLWHVVDDPVGIHEVE